MNEEDIQVNQNPDLSTQLINALLADRRADRRSRNVKLIVISAFVFGYLGLASLTYIANQAETLSSGTYVSEVDINGEIGPDKSASMDGLREPLIKAFEDSGSKGVVIKINSPGGTPVQAALINKKLKELKKKYNKRVVVVAEDMDTSGAYMISVAADSIYANESSIVGSIGVISRRFGYSGLMQKLGIESRTMTAGKSKDMGDPFTPRSDADDAKMRTLLDGIHKNFIDMVKEDRGAKLAPNGSDLFTGEVWLGKDALKYGLIDHIGTFSEAIKAEFGVSKVKVFQTESGIMGLAKKFLPKSISHVFMQDSQVPLSASWGESHEGF